MSDADLPEPPPRGPRPPFIPRQNGPPAEETGEGRSRRQLTPNHLRAAYFPTVQQGYDPEAVQDYLDRIADELLRLHRELHAAYAETERIVRHLHRWQNDQTALCQRPRDPGSAHRTSRDRWPINPS